MNVCVMSMVHDHMQPLIPDIKIDQWPIPAATIKWPPDPAIDLSELTRLIAEFRELIAAAKLIDDKTGQPDCVDPLKEKLQARVAELEKLIAAPPEFVIVEGGGLEPGRYRVIDGKLYRAV